MGRALYRKYRSKSLAEIVGQAHITDALDRAVKAGKISHAYLFTGPRGVGKTSIARILAHAVNDLPYEDDSAHLDIIEIDAASNRRIDEIRDLRDKVHVAPTSLRYKVYIIDEVHMLTREAFNALLKTLEEPPEHVIFILATTEAHKLPETIVSRTQRYAFKPIAAQAAVEHLANIAKREKIAIDPAALELIAEHGDGSFRDAISLLDQVSGLDGQVTADSVRQMLGIAPREMIDQLVEGLATTDMAGLIELLAEMRRGGLAASNIAKQLSDELRSQLVGGQAKLDKQTSFKLLKDLLDIPTSSSPEQLLEIILLGAVLEKAPDTATPTSVSPPIASVTPKAAPPATVKQEKAKPKEPTPPSRPQKAVSRLDSETWAKILDDCKKRHSTLYGVLRMGSPSFDNNILTLGFKFAFHSKQLSEAGNRAKIMDIISGHMGDGVSLEFAVGPEFQPANIATAPLSAERPPIPAKAGDNEAITNIFGAVEVLDS